MKHGLKIVALPLVLICFACGCVEKKPRVKVGKVISEKLASTEQRLGYDFFDSKNHFRSRAETVYYLIAEDGTMIEVDLKEYAKTKVGQSVQSSDWE
jgi:hypothetical protein